MSVLRYQQLSKSQKNIGLSDSLASEIIENFPEGVWSVDAVTKEVLYYNYAAEKFFGEELELFYLKEDIGWEIIHPEDRDRVQHSLSQILENDVVEIEYRRSQSLGEMKVIREKKWLVKDEFGNPVRLDGTIAEISQEKPTIPTNSTEAENDLENCCEGCEFNILKLKGCPQDGRTDVSSVSPSGSDISPVSPSGSDVSSVSPEIELRELVKREALQNRLINLIRNSLDLDKILETTVWEIRDLLEIDRCYFLWYKQAEWEIVKEAKIASLPSAAELYPGDALRPISENVLQTEMLRVDSVDTCEQIELLRFFIALEYMSVLILRIKTASGKIGALVLAHCSSSRGWKDCEVELLRAVANQVAIAIEQAELYGQSRESARIATAKTLELEQTVSKLQKAQAQLVQSEKMSSLGQLVAGVAHEINNPVSFIYGNLFPATDYMEDILGLMQLYQQHYPEPPSEIEKEIERIELDFVVEDLPRLFNSMKIGADRIRDLVKSLRIFSRLDESDLKEVELHENIDSTVMILQSRFKEKANIPAIELVKQYGKLPKVECYPGQLNQVFMHLIANAIDALEARDKKRSFEEIVANPSTCWIKTQLVNNKAVQIRIADNGIGISSDALSKIFDPFYTTKAVGSGTGLGLSISYQVVVEKHGGCLRCISEEGVGTEFVIEIPLTIKN
jgi:signal transduction histidine kinase